MGTYLKLLQIELNSLDQNDFYEPDAEVESDDSISGELSDELIRLYTVWRITEKSSLEKAIEAKYGRGSDEQRTKLLCQADELRDKAKLLRELFWVEVKDEFGLWDKSSVGVRRGRKVVWFESRHPRIFGIEMGGYE